MNSHGNINAWDKKREKFFKSDPRCSVCKGKILHYTKKGMCSYCRAIFNANKFKGKTPEYHKDYNKIRDKGRWEKEKRRRALLK